jgi:two-component sensor histidine kinase
VDSDTGVYAKVKVEGEDRLVVVPVSSNKPPIPAEVLDKWQKIVDLVAGIVRVPSGLITRLTEENLEIVAASLTPGNPYARDDHDRLGIGMFCESVAGRRRALVVDDTATTAYWAGNPHAGFGMRTYMGVPIEWEDGELFGTFCVLSDRANSLEASFLALMRQFKEIIETDLRLILLTAELREHLSQKDLELREIHHRLKNQFNLLIGYISVRVYAEPGKDVERALKEVQHRIMAISLVHEQLHKAAEGAAPSLDVYLPRICGYIVKDLLPDRIAVDYRIAPVALTMEQEVTLAMIVSELLSNTAKYAFGPDRPGHIYLSAEREADGALALVYRDDGVGLPAGFDPAAAGTLGMTLIGALAEQLNGSVKAETGGGAKFSFRFAL